MQLPEKAISTKRCDWPRAWSKRIRTLPASSIRLVGSYYKKNLYAAAVEQLQKAVSMNEAAARAANGSPSATYHYHLGMALKGKGDKEESRRELEAALRLG